MSTWIILRSPMPRIAERHQERHQRVIHQGGRLDSTGCRWANVASSFLSRSIQLWAMLCDAKSQILLVGSPGLFRSAQYLPARVSIKR